MGNEATGLFDIVLVGADSRLELTDVVPHVARLSGLAADAIGPRIAAGVPFFVARNLDRGATRTQLEAYRAVGARVKPWQAGVPLPAYEAVAPVARDPEPQRVSGPAPRATFFVADDPFATPPPPTRTRAPSLTELDAPLEVVVASPSRPAMMRPATTIPTSSPSVRPPSVPVLPAVLRTPTPLSSSGVRPATTEATPAPGRPRSSSSMRMPAVSGDRSGGR